MSSDTTLARDVVHDYWLDPSDPWEQPSNYVGSFPRSEVLLELLEPRTTPSDQVLEVGCGAGANLAHLHDRGYRDLAAIELNPEMLALFETTYEPTFRATDVRRGSLEHEIWEFPSDGVDATAAVTVLAHLHPTSEFVFDELVRVTADWLVTVENETTDDRVFFPRNYRDVFESRGCRQVDVVDSETLHERTELSDNCVARVFAVGT
ncbi:class I SAM-dependent methyltransferase [Salinigranum salinum]|uniref:class I SAM-dependent methyltransferase n=1 Tax=Salinigranum salinum TaxID=1364937 RepID=UPI001261069A|nr:class I SAM-dependent methyltransferase [Salinigranum salinum]